MIPTLTTAALMSTRQEAKPWLWRGYIAPGEITLFTALWKLGKSTLISVILSKMKDGGELAGLPISAAKVLVISEEPPSKWAERGHRLGFGDHVTWMCRPFNGKPTHEDWIDLIRQILAMHTASPIDLIVIDSFSNIAPMRSENDSVEMLRTILPLQELTKRGIAILISHHPRKGTLLPGQAARGSGALSAQVDTIIEMHRISAGHARDRRRRLHAYSRSDETPATTILELNPEGTDYLHLTGNGELSFDRAWPIIHDILEHAETWQHLSTRDIQRHWPENTAPPAYRTLQEWLKKAHNDKLVQRTGDGVKKNPFKFCLPEMPDIWQQRLLEELCAKPLTPINTPRPALEPASARDPQPPSTPAPKPAHEPASVLDPATQSVVPPTVEAPKTNPPPPT